MENITTVFIDLDGTLTDSCPGILNSIRYSLNKMGIPIPSEDILRTFIGPPLRESYARHLGLTGARGEEAQEAYREYFRAGGMFENSVYDGVTEMLERLRAAGKRLVVATSKPEEFSLKIISHFGLDKYFDLIAGASMDASRNQKTAVIAYALEQLGITDPSQVIMVGDRHHDVEGAAEHGIKCIGVTYGYGDAGELLSAGAIALAATPAEVAEIILS